MTLIVKTVILFCVCCLWAAGPVCQELQPPADTAVTSHTSHISQQQQQHQQQQHGHPRRYDGRGEGFDEQPWSDWWLLKWSLQDPQPAWTRRWDDDITTIISMFEQHLLRVSRLLSNYAIYALFLNLINIFEKSYQWMFLVCVQMTMRTMLILLNGQAVKIHSYNERFICLF